METLFLYSDRNIGNKNCVTCINDYEMIESAYLHLFK